MKTIITVTLIALVATFSAPSMAAGEMQHDGMKMPSKASSDTQMAEGTVKKVDKTAGKVTLAHGPLTHLGMSMGMTMAFRVKDAAWLREMKEGDKIRFLAEEANGVYTVIKYESAH